ncbi:MAG: hypothetical protein V4754_12455 [Pseudomonadota bacterium]
MATIKNDKFSEISELIQSQIYIAISELIIKKSNKILCSDIYDAELQFCLKMIEASEISILEAKNLIFSKSTHFFDYCLAYMTVENNLEQGQQYNPNESQEDFDNSYEEYVGHSKTFIFQNAIFYIILKDKSNILIQFLKKIKQPNHLKFAQQLTTFFNQLKN